MTHPSAGIVVARQAGTATAFGPVLAYLTACGARYIAFAYPPASTVWADLGLEHGRVETFPEAWGEGIAPSTAPWVLTGTSFSAADDAEWWNWARDLGIRSIGFVDQWVNFRERFSSPGRKWDLLPDTIAVIDTTARQGIADLGGPLDRIVVTGTPAIDLLGGPAPPEASALREQLVPEGGRLVLVPCVPEREGSIRDQLEPVAAVLDALQARRSDEPEVVVVVKPHPLDEATFPRDLTEFGCERARVVTGSRLAVLHAADVVVGRLSMMVYEAAVLGKPAVALSDSGVVPDIVTAVRSDDLVRHLHPLVEAPPLPVTRRAGHASAAFVDALGLL